MAVTAGRAGYGTVDDIGQDVLALSTGVAAVMIGCLPTSVNNALVNIPVLHGSAYVQVAAGQSHVFRRGLNSITTVNVKALDNSADSSVSWAVVAVL